MHRKMNFIFFIKFLKFKLLKGLWDLCAERTYQIHTNHQTKLEWQVQSSRFKKKAKRFSGTLMPHANWNLLISQMSQKVEADASKDLSAIALLFPVISPIHPTLENWAKIFQVLKYHVE